MAKTTDDLYDKLDELLNALNGRNSGVDGGAVKTKFNGFDDFLDYTKKKDEDFRKDIEIQEEKSERKRKALYKARAEENEELFKQERDNIKALYEELDNLDESASDYADKYAEKVDEINKHTEAASQYQSNYLNFANKASSISIFDASVKDGDKIVSTIKSMYKDIMGLTGSWKSADAAASKYAKTIGLSKDGMDNLRKNTLSNVFKNTLSVKYNISEEELLEAQTNYVKNAGRNIRISNEDQEYIAAMRAVTGERGNEIASQLDTFGVSMSSTAERVGKMFSVAAKEGLSFEKYSDNVAKNLKLAQNFTFKNGTKGLEAMAKKATAIKMDMQQIATFAEKIGSVETSIETSAQLQVLGGPFASMANPMGMLNESLNDLEGLQDRMAKMVSGLGYFDKTTGEINMSSFNKKRVEAASKATGISYDTLMETAFAQARRNEIEKNINASSNARGLSDEMKELIKNSGTFQNGKAGVSIKGEFKTLDELSNKDYENLKAEGKTDSENIKDIAQNLRSLLDLEKGVGRQTNNYLANIFGGIANFVKWTLSGIGGLVAGIGALGVVGKTGLNIRSLFKGFGGAFKGTTGGAANAEGVGVTSRGSRGFLNRMKGMFTSTTSGAANAEGISRVGGRGKLGKRALVKVLGKGGAKTALKLGGKLASNLAKGGPLGLVAGAVGMIGDGLMDRAISKGKMEKGGVGHHIGSAATGALQGAAIGSLLGPIGAAVGGVIGGVHGLLKAGKAKQEKLLDSRAEKLGVEVKGKYGRGKLKEINEGLETGEISKSVRRKLEANGDFALLDQIDKIAKQKKEEKEKKKEQKHQRRKELLSTVFSKDKSKFGVANITVETAMFGGRGINGLFGNISVRRQGVGISNIISKAVDTVKVIKETGKLSSAWEAIKPKDKSISELQKGKTEENIPRSFDINIKGSLKLVGETGQSVDIVKLLKDNPVMLRNVADIIAKEIGYLDKNTYQQ